MITITDAAIEKIKLSASLNDMSGLALRVAATRQEDGSISYGMGFDEKNEEVDALIECGGIEVIVGPSSRELLTGLTIDYVKLDDGEENFIFINPNDPTHGQTH
jgi:iron-sulfur cluster assembly protein